MKTKFKDFLLYSLACVGAVSLFLSAYQPQQTTSTVPEPLVWEMTVLNNNQVYSINKQTGELRAHLILTGGDDASTIRYNYWTAEKLENFISD